MKKEKSFDVPLKWVLVVALLIVAGQVVTALYSYGRSQNTVEVGKVFLGMGTCSISGKYCVVPVTNSGPESVVAESCVIYDAGTFETGTPSGPTAVPAGSIQPITCVFQKITSGLGSQASGNIDFNDGSSLPFMGEWST